MCTTKQSKDTYDESSTEISTSKRKSDTTNCSTSTSTGKRHEPSHISLKSCASASTLSTSNQQSAKAKDNQRSDIHIRIYVSPVNDSVARMPTDKLMNRKT